MQTIQTRVAQVFWGLVIIGVDFHVRGFDVAPDCVGYILVALGAGGLAGLSRHFTMARLLSWILAPVSAAGLVFHGKLATLGWILRVPLDGAMMWFLLSGVMEFALSKQRTDLASRASICRIAYVSLLCAGGIIGMIPRGLPSVASLLGTITFVAMLVLLAVILHLLYQVKRETVSASRPEDFKEAA